MKLIPVELSRIIIDEKRQDQVVVLKEKGGEQRQVPIVIGFMEASSIKIKLSGVDVPRPMTHDLIVNLIASLEATPERIIIDKLVNSTFHAKLELKNKAGQTVMIDCRPSDSIALAVRLKAPIFVAPDIFEKSALSQ